MLHELDVNWTMFSLQTRDPVQSTVWLRYLMSDYRHLLSLTPPSSLSTPHLGKLIRKPRCLVTRRQFESYRKTLTSAQPLTTLKSPSQSPFLIPQMFQAIFTSAWEFCPALPRKLHYENKAFQTFLVCVWHQQCGNPNHILCGDPSQLYGLDTTPSRHDTRRKVPFKEDIIILVLERSLYQKNCNKLGF